MEYPGPRKPYINQSSEPHSVSVMLIDGSLCTMHDIGIGNRVVFGLMDRNPYGWDGLRWDGPSSKSRGSANTKEGRNARDWRRHDSRLTS